MFFEKKGAKMLASAMALTLAVTGLAYSPKVKAASDQAPTVKILGATLRLDGETGKQSMRLGIEVSNASNAEACGIKITANGKTVTVGTDVVTDKGSLTLKNPNVYSKDDKSDKIVYTAVVTGIPQAKYDELFEVKGYVKVKAAADLQGESVAVKRSVQGVVDLLKETYPELGLNLNEAGNLVKTVAGNQVDVEEGDFSKGGGINQIPSGVTALDLKTCFYDDSSLKKVENPNGSVTFTSTTDGGVFAGVIAKLPASLRKDDSVNITVDYECVGGGENPSDTARVYLLAGRNDVNMAKGQLGPNTSLSGRLVANASADSIYIKANSHNTKFASLTVKKILVEVGETIAPVDAPATGFNEDGTQYTLPINANTIKSYEGTSEMTYSAYNSVKISINSSIGIQLPKEVYEKYKFTKAIITYKDSTNATACGFVAKYDTDNMGWADLEEAHYGWNTLNGEGTVEAIPNSPDTGNFSGIRIFNTEKEKGKTITITSVVFVKA